MTKRGRMARKGQVTLFIIVAIVVVAVAVIVALLWPQISSMFMTKQQAQSYISTQAEELRSRVDFCVGQVSESVFVKMGLNAGYYDTTGLTKAYYAGNDFVVVVFKNAANQKINKLPGLGQIENQYLIFLKLEGNQAIDKCVNLDSFKGKISIEAGERKITPMIYQDSVVLKVDWPMKISKQVAQGNAEATINQRDTLLEIPLGNLWLTANSVVDCELRKDCKFEGIKWDEETWNNPFRLQYITKEARTIEENKIVFLLQSQGYRPDEKPFSFNFAIDRS